MKYKKRSLKKQRQRRHRFLKKYTNVQRGGGLMDEFPALNTAEGGNRNTCMAVHPTQPLVVIGDAAGNLTLFEINISGLAQPKRLAQLIGLPAVTCVEFHPILPVVAAACSDRVLICRFDQISGEQLELLKTFHSSALDEVSCFAFHPTNTNTNTYIAIGVNNKTDARRNRIIMCSFNIESKESKVYVSSILIPAEATPAPAQEVLMTSFSRDGSIFAFVTKFLDGSGTTVLKVQNFKGDQSVSGRGNFAQYIYREKDHAITCITPYDTKEAGYHDGTFYRSIGPMNTHGFIIGCDDGSLILINAVTIKDKNSQMTKLETLMPMKKWNGGEAIKCVAVHPSILPLFASGSRSTVQLWEDIEPQAKKPLLALQSTVTPVISVGFHPKFLAVCGPGGLRAYSCGSDDYRGYKEKLRNESTSLAEIGDFSSKVTLANRQGECIICGEPMNDPQTQPALRLVPEEAQEIYLTCGHKFHEKCIRKWIGQGKTCPLCKQTSDFAQQTPKRISESRVKELEDRIKGLTIGINDERFKRVLDFRRNIAQGSPLRLIRARQEAARQEQEEQEEEEEEQEEPRDSSVGGGRIRNKNKYSRRRKNSSKKSKFRHRHRYSKKNKNAN